MARTLERLSEESRSSKIYVTPLPAPFGRSPDDFARAVGLPEWPATTFPGSKAETHGDQHQGEEPSRSQLYRFLGLQRDELDSDSVVVIFANLRTVPEGRSGEDELFSALVPSGADIPFVELNWGHSVIRPTETRGERMFLVLDNRALLDVWVKWDIDTHQAPQTDFLQNGHSQERKSRKVPVSTGAVFGITVYRNAGGRIGDEIGNFSITVQGRDQVNFITAEIGGQRFFQAISLAMLGKIILSVLL